MVYALNRGGNTRNKRFLGCKSELHSFCNFFFFFNSHVSNLVIVVLFFSSVAEGRVMLLSNIFVEETGLKYLLIS